VKLRKGESVGKAQTNSLVAEQHDTTIVLFPKTNKGKKISGGEGGEGRGGREKEKND
jgi:hypothetical protein